MICPAVRVIACQQESGKGIIPLDIHLGIHLNLAEGLAQTSKYDARQKLHRGSLVSRPRDALRI